jgi:hypothetical protein
MVLGWFVVCWMRRDRILQSEPASRSVGLAATVLCHDDFGLHGDHKVLDSAGLTLRSGDETSEFEDATPSDKLRSFVLHLASHGSLGRRHQEEDKALRCNSTPHQQDTSGRPLPELPDSKSLSNAALKTLPKWQVFPSIPPYLQRTAVRGATPRAACPETPLHPQRGEPAHATAARSDPARHRVARTRQSRSGRRTFSRSLFLAEASLPGRWSFGTGAWSGACPCARHHRGPAPRGSGRGREARCEPAASLHPI